MKTKIVGILVCMLLIATALPAVGTMNEVKEEHNTSAFIKSQEVIKENEYSMHDLIVEWEQTYGGVNIEVFRTVRQTNDGGYIAVGAWNATRTPTDSGAHWLVKVDANGNEEWNATALPNASSYPRCYNVEQTSDGGYVTAGCHESGTWGYNRCIWKVDEDGNTEWLTIYDYDDLPYGYHTCIQQTNDGGYIVTGEIDIGPTDWDVLLMKTNATGAVEWQQVYRYGDYGDNAYAVRQTDDGGYILCGRTGTGSALLYSDLLVIKTDSNGDIEWDNTYGGDRADWTQSSDILFADDGGYYFLGETDSFGAGSRDAWLIKTDADGNEEWNKTFGGTTFEMCGGMDFTDDGGIILTGTLDRNGITSPRSEGLVIKTDENGILEWQQTFGDEGYDELQSVCVTSDGDYVVAGDLDSSPGLGLIDSWLIKINAFENTHPDKPAKPSGQKRVNANTAYTYTSSTSDSDGDQLYYQWDWGDGNLSEWLGPYNSGDTVEAENSWQQSGRYNVKVCAKDEHSAESEWSDSLTFSIPSNNVFNFNFNLLERLFAQFPNAFPVLRAILGF